MLIKFEVLKTVKNYRETSDFRSCNLSEFLHLVCVKWVKTYTNKGYNNPNYILF